MTTLAELMSLESQVAVITGGAGHIGEALCEALAELGANIAILDILPNAMIRVGQNIRTQYNVEVEGFVVDLANESDIRSIPDKVIERFGKVNILINNAAFVGTTNLEGWSKPFLEQSVNTWSMALEVNLTAPFLLSQIFSPYMMTQHNANIINISSIYGMMGPNWEMYKDTNMGNPAAYAASKGGLLQLTRWLATTLSPNIRVNSITPGGVFRNQPESFHQRYIQGTPLQRMACEDDFKGAVVYLATALSRYVTGHNLVVDGGWTIW